MNEIGNQLEILRKNIVSIRGGYTYDPTWNQYLKVFIEGIEIVRKMKKLENVRDDEWYALRKLGEELLKQGVHNPVEDTRRYKLIK